VVIGHLRIVDEPPSQRTLTRTSRQQPAKGTLDRFDDLQQSARHILRQMAAVRTRIADQLVTLIQRLRDVQCLLCAEAEQAIAVPLQFRKIVKQRRSHALRLGLK
jgi:hypothetical protein